jgi:hypothetical protein
MVPKGDLPLPAEIFPAIFLLWVLLCVFFFQAGAPVDGYTHSTEKRGGGQEMVIPEVPSL